MEPTREPQEGIGDAPSDAQSRRKSEDLAFAELIDQCRRRVFGFIYKRQRNEALAWDLTAQVVKRAWQSRRTFDQSRSFVFWLLGIARNVVSSHGRHEGAAKRQPHRGSQPCDLRPSTDGAADGVEDDTELLPDEAAMRKELAAAVRCAIGRLKESDSSVVYDFYFEGRTVAEISFETGRTETAVESLLHRAREKLRSILEPQLRQMGYLETKLRERRCDSN